MKKAIIFGASGFVGGFLVDKLLASDYYNEVLVVVRKPILRQHPKLKIIIADFDTLNTHQKALIANDVFIALGTTKKKTPNEQQYYKIDHDYPVLAAKYCLQNGASNVLLVSAVGANSSSSIFYTRTKGDVERDIIALNYENTHIFRPSMIMGSRAENRPTEKMLLSFWGGLNFLFFGKMHKYRGINAEEIAIAMVNAANLKTEKLSFYHWDEIKSLNK